MNFRFLLLLVGGLCILLQISCLRRNSDSEKKETYVRMVDKSSSNAIKVNGKVNYTFQGSDGLSYYFSMSDTVPTLPYYIPHVLLSQGDPLNLHSVVTLNNISKIGNDTLNAVIGVLDNSGVINNVLKATAHQIGIQTTLANDNTGGAYYGFTREGMVFEVGEGKSFDQTYLLSNRKGKPGQVLTLNASADTASWANSTPVSSVKQKYFAPKNGQTIEVAKYGYNIINPNSGLTSLAISLPATPIDNDWFEITFTEPVKTVIYTGGKVANNAIKTASINNYYKKFVFRRADSTWY